MARPIKRVSPFLCSGPERSLPGPGLRRYSGVAMASTCSRRLTRSLLVIAAPDRMTNHAKSARGFPCQRLMFPLAGMFVLPRKQPFLIQQAEELDAVSMAIGVEILQDRQVLQ